MKSAEGCFLSIGAGKNQIPLIHAAKARGLHVIAVDRDSTAPGFKDSDIRILESTVEYRKILHAMSRVPYTHVLKGVGSRSFGGAIHSTAYLAEKFKLTGSSPSSISLFANKRSCKALLEKNGILVPKTLALPVSSPKSKKEVQLPYPILAKPAEGFAKKGISVIQDEKEWKVWSKGKKLTDWILEPKIEGNEVTVLGMVIQGQFHILSLSDKITTTEPPFIELVHIVPSANIRMTGEIKMICQSIVNITKLTNSPFVAEFKITDTGECYLIEAAPEVGGEFLADALVKAHYSYSYFPDLLALYIGESPKLQFLLKEPKQNKLSAILFVLPDHKTKAVPPHTDFPLIAGESIFMKEELLPTATLLTNKEGNARRTFVYGISSTSAQNRDEWIQSLIDRSGGRLT
jgi:biotin carboxylase